MHCHACCVLWSSGAAQTGNSLMHRCARSASLACVEAVAPHTPAEMYKAVNNVRARQILFALHCVQLALAHTHIMCSSAPAETARLDTAAHGGIWRKRGHCTVCGCPWGPNSPARPSNMHCGGSAVCCCFVHSTRACVCNDHYCSTNRQRCTERPLWVIKRLPCGWCGPAGTWICPSMPLRYCTPCCSLACDDCVPGLC